MLEPFKKLKTEQPKFGRPAFPRFSHIMHRQNGIDIFLLRYAFYLRGNDVS